ncbi:MAG: universal stress protein [Candidatus Binatia bacterium]
MAETTPRFPSQLTNALPWKRVLVPVDFSPLSETALIYALKLAQLVGAEVHACHIIPTPHVLDVLYERGFAPPESIKRITQKARKRIKEIAGTQETTVPLRIHCEEGEAAEHILQQAETLKVDLIVIGTHGRSGAQRFFLGSVAETVIRRASCPVLTLRS